VVKPLKYSIPIVWTLASPWGSSPLITHPAPLASDPLVSD
jgi:hypothetical protein